MKIINNIFKLFLFAILLTVGSCETLDLDQLDNPSTLPPDKLDPVYVMNYVQLTLPDFVYSANSFTQRVTRQMAMTGGISYNNAFAPVNFDNNWTTGYLMLNSIKLMEPRARANEQTFILGATKVMRSYILLTMVDMYGDIPYSEALQGNDNPRPRFDKSEDVYAGIYQELNDAIVELNKTDNAIGALKARDLYYGSGNEGNPNKDGWVKLANTLKLKMLVTSRVAGGFGGLDLASEINSLVSSGKIINTSAEDFAFRYGTERDLPNSRHPQYNDHYEFGGGAYIANYFMWAVGVEKGSVVDPRLNYYFFKQATLGDNMNSQTVPCDGFPRPGHYNLDEYASFYNGNIRAPFCISNTSEGAAFLGRDHGDASGIPADVDLRAVVGVYPAGGLIGSPDWVSSSTNAGLKGGLGQGIMPMIMSSYVRFLKAEAILKISGVVGNAKAELEEGMKQSINKTVYLLPQYAPGSVGTNIPSVAEFELSRANYIAFVLNRYDTATPAEQLQIIIKEYYVASWGNGIEPYNNYRRTGYPDNFQPTVEDGPGEYFATALYPGASVTTNPNAPTNVRTKQVFWADKSLDLH